MAFWPVKIARQAYGIFADIILNVQPLLLRTNECLPSSLYMFSGLQSQQPLTQPTPCLSTYGEIAEENLATIPFAYKSKIATNKKLLHTSKFYLYKCAISYTSH